MNTANLRLTKFVRWLRPWGYYRSLVGIHVDASQGGKATIWGMIVTGTNWVNHTETTVHDAASLPHKLVIHILGPGHLVFSCGLTRVVETIGGEILMEGFDPFRSKWLPKHFEPVRAALIGRIAANSLKKSNVKLCDSFSRDVAQNVMRRVLRLVRGRGHGGMLIYLNDENDSRLDNWLRIRMRFKEADATNRFQKLMLNLMQTRHGGWRSQRNRRSALERLFADARRIAPKTARFIDRVQSLSGRLNGS